MDSSHTGAPPKYEKEDDELSVDLTLFDIEDDKSSVNLTIFNTEDDKSSVNLTIFNLTISQTVPSSSFLDSCCYRRTRHTTDSYPNFSHIARQKLLAYLLESD
jgi:hypothetical protein